MAKFWVLLMWGMLLFTPAMAAEPWEGSWKVSWPDGGDYLALTQNGNDVRGNYQSDGDSIEATATGRHLEGLIIHNGGNESFRITLDEKSGSFSGATSAGEWLSGIRLPPNGTADSPAADLKNPRTAMRSFLDAGNLTRLGDIQALATAIKVIDFGGSAEWSSHSQKIRAAEQLFDLVDLATFSLASIPEDISSSRVGISLPRLGAASPVELEMGRDADGNWRIIMPTGTSLSAIAGAAEARAADAFRQLQSPRDTVRSFLEGLSRWDDDGKQLALSTLDLSGVPEVIRVEQGELTAQYLVRIMDRVGQMPLQSIPNSGASREPFVYFQNPSGQIVIEPTGAGAETRWKFSRQSVREMRRIFAAIQSLPEVHTLGKEFVPPSAMFAIREQVKAYAPVLLRDLAGRGRIEYWQIIGGLLMVTIMALIATGTKRLASRLLLRPALKHHSDSASRLPWAIGITVAFICGAQVIGILGLPVTTRQYTVPIIGPIFLLTLAYAAWHIIGIVSNLLEDYTERTTTSVDNIMLTFMRGVARLLVVGAAGLGLGHILSIPTTGIIAGLGIGGLAIAFASKETLANVFGAGILLGDSPFKKGDRIIAGDVNGWVEAVGLRSTRVRTLYDSLLIVPNSKLADSPINNLGARRRRTLMTTILVTSGSTPKKLRSFTGAITHRISSDSFFEPGEEVNVIGIVANGIQIEISASLDTRRGVDSRAATHRLFLDIMEMAEAEGLTLGRGMERHPVYLLQEN